MQDKEEKGTTQSKKEDKKPGEWSKEDMENAQPLPLPELDDDDDEDDS